MACTACGTARARAWTACGDVFKHANAAGTSKLGGVLALAADDHACRSLDAAARFGRRIRQRDDADPQSGRACRTSSTWACSAGRCRATPGAGSASRRSPKRWSPRRRSTSNPLALDIVMPDDFDMPRGRPQHPLAGSAAGPGNAPAPVRGQGRAGVRARQPHRPHRDRFAERAAGHHHHRQVLPRRAAGAGIPRPRRSRVQPTSASASTRSA